MATYQVCLGFATGNHGLKDVQYLAVPLCRRKISGWFDAQTLCEESSWAFVWWMTRKERASTTKDRLSLVSIFKSLGLGDGRAVFTTLAFIMLARALC